MKGSIYKTLDGCQTCTLVLIPMLTENYKIVLAHFLQTPVIIDGDKARSWWVSKRMYTFCCIQKMRLVLTSPWTWSTSAYQHRSFYEQDLMSDTLTSRRGSKKSCRNLFVQSILCKETWVFLIILKSSMVYLLFLYRLSQDGSLWRQSLILDEKVFWMASNVC